MLNPTDQEFSITRTIGRGNSRPGDVVRLRRALNRTGHGRFPQNPAKNVTPGLMQATERFQRDFALKPDGVVEPGGPTERMMRIVERTDREIGEDGVRVMSEAVRRLNEAGFEFLPDPARPRAGMFVNELGKPAGQEALLAAAEKSGPIQLAAADKPGDVGDQTGRKEATKNVMKVFRRSPIGVILQILMNADSKLPKEPTDKERSTGAGAKQKERGVPKTVLPPDDIPKQIPPFPGEPPKDLVKNREEYPIDEDARKPTIHVNPIPELKKPEIETFPDHSKLREAFIIMESRGTPEGQVKDAQEIIDRVLKRAKERGIRVTLTHGGFQPSFDPANPGEKMKERVFQRWPKKNLGSRRSDIEFTVEDGEIKFSDNINVVTTLVDGITANSDERKASADIKEILRFNDRTLRYFIELPKSTMWDEETWEKEMDDFADKWLDGVEKQLKWMKENKIAKFPK